MYLDFVGRNTYFGFLASQRGTLFRDVAQLAEPVVRILRDPALKQRLEHNAYAYGRETAWPRVGEQMRDVQWRATASARASRAVAPAVVSSRSASGQPQLKG